MCYVDEVKSSPALLSARITIAVRTGAWLLSKHIPDWFQRVNPLTLRMDDSYQCVLGQQGDYLQMIRMLGAEGDSQHEFAVEYGFDICTECSVGLGGCNAFTTLNDLWKQEIRSRRATAAVGQWKVT